MAGVSKAEFWTLTPLEILAQLEHRRFERAWWSSRVAAVVCATATTKDGRPLDPRDLFWELRDD